MNFRCWLHYTITFIHIILVSIFTYIKSRFFGNKQRVRPLFNRDGHIAIVGGGIGGASAAYALIHSGYRNVTIYEARDQLGGNAKTHLWQEETKAINTGLSVLAWPLIFRNYIHLLNQLNIPTTMVQLPFCIHHKDGNRIFGHRQQEYHTKRYSNELKRWNHMVDIVRYTSEFFNGKEMSLYHFSLLNPFNYISLRMLSVVFGISSDFWNHLVVPMYASSFLSTKLSFIPAAILPTIDSLISLQPNSIPTMQTWMGTSMDVFEKMTKGTRVKTNHRVQQVHIQRRRNNQISISIDQENILYDRIIFACNAETTVQALTTGMSHPSYLLKLLLSNISYGDADDLNMLDGIIHRDRTILPMEYADELCRDYANYIDVKYDPQKQVFYQYNTFILSSWLPNVHAMLKENQREHRHLEPMLVTYASADQPPPKIDPRKIFGNVDNRRAHPSLSFRNQAISLLIRFVQGENGIYFCGNAVTPANGHDLSLLSGFAVAELIGAKYPFENDAAALRDYHRFKRMCVD